MRLAFFTDIDWTMMGPGEDLRGVCRVVEAIYASDGAVIPVTAKSIYEVVNLLDEVCIPGDMFISIVESGGAIYASPGILSKPDGSKIIGGTRLEYMELGTRIEEFRDRILSEARAAGCRIELLSAADTGTASMMTGLSPGMARYAAMREYLEVVWSPSQGCLDYLADVLYGMGYYIHRSIRLLHVGLHKGKLWGVMAVGGEPVLEGATTIGLGDSDADRDYLEHVDIAIIIPAPGYRLRVRPMRSDYSVAPHPAPRGWVDAVREVLVRYI